MRQKLFAPHRNTGTTANFKARFAGFAQASIRRSVAIINWSDESRRYASAVSMAEVKISIDGQQITSIITASSARKMQLKPGQIAATLIKATEVMVLRV